MQFGDLNKGIEWCQTHYKGSMLLAADRFGEFELDGSAPNVE